MYPATIGICRKGSLETPHLYLVFKNIDGYRYLSGYFRFGNGNLLCIDLCFAFGIQRIHGYNHFDFVLFQRSQDDTLALADVFIFQGISRQSPLCESGTDIRPVIRLHRIAFVRIQRNFGIFNKGSLLINLYVFLFSGCGVCPHIAFRSRPDYILGAFGTLLHHYIHRESGKVLDFKLHQLGHDILALECEFL